MKTLFALLLTSASLVAADITLAWDASPDPGVNYALLWNAQGTTETNRLDAGSALTVTITNCPVGRWQAVCIAVDPFDPSNVSEPSNSVEWEVKPAAPRNLRVTVQTSTNLTHWQDGPTLLIPIAPELAGQEFFRSRLNFEILNPQPATLNLPH